MTAPASVDRAERKCGECVHWEQKDNPLAGHCLVKEHSCNAHHSPCPAFSDGEEARRHAEFVKNVKALCEAWKEYVEADDNCVGVEDAEAVAIADDKLRVRFAAVLASSEMKEKP